MLYTRNLLQEAKDLSNTIYDKVSSIVEPFHIIRDIRSLEIEAKEITIYKVNISTLHINESTDLLDYAKQMLITYDYPFLKLDRLVISNTGRLIDLQYEILLEKL